MYNDILVGRFINCVMKRGLKQKAENVVYGAFDIIKNKLNTEPVEVFKKAIQNCEPLLEVRSRRVGGSNYQVPTEVRPERRKALAIKWILTYANEKAGKSMSEKVASELMAAANNEGSAVKKKEDVHRMAEANKAFAHFRW
ncbi:MAG: 30S ribosomal protein S7 [Chlorobi bacterium]|nr:30S ribosomal protein S7 [Chlorobiota bacterium]MCI0714935.1 30S ribosomal protein S7 [Chlorobiota bacterium]